MTHIVVLGASSGGLEAVRTMLAMLPADFPAVICVVIHTSPQAPEVLADILNRGATLTVLHPHDRELPKPGHVYAAPPDRHLLVEPGRLRVTKGPREHRFRPAVDPLFQSAAQVFGPGTIGVILSGNLDDGTSGLDVIKRLGGAAVVQDPADALFPSMPQSAIDHVTVDHVVPLARIAPLLVDLTRPPAGPPRPEMVPEDVEIEVKIASEQNPIDAGLEQLAEPSRFACPECHGVLLQFKDTTRIRFRCHTGHAYSVDSLIAAVSEGVEDSLWNSLRSLEEAGLLLRTLAVHLKEGHQEMKSERLLEQSDEAHKHAEVVRQLVTVREPLPPQTSRDRQKPGD